MEGNEFCGEVTHVVHAEEIQSLVEKAASLKNGDEMLACYPRFNAIVGPKKIFGLSFSLPACF